MSGSPSCCKCCFGTIFSAGLTSLLIWLSLQTTNPHSSIEYFYLPALNKSTNPLTPNRTIYFHLKLENPNKDKGIFYDALNLTFLYQHTTINGTKNSTGFELFGNKTINGFYQGHKKKATRRDSVAPGGVDWAAVNGELSRDQKVVFRVDMVTAVRFKYMFWHNKRQNIKVGANVEVNDQGVKGRKKGIKLKSGAGHLLSSHHVPTLVGVLVLLLLVF